MLTEQKETYVELRTQRGGTHLVAVGIKAPVAFFLFHAFVPGCSLLTSAVSGELGGEGKGPSASSIRCHSRCRTNRDVLVQRLRLLFSLSLSTQNDPRLASEKFSPPQREPHPRKYSRSYTQPPAVLCCSDQEQRQP